LGLERFKAKRVLSGTLPGNLALKEKFIKKGQADD